ncbi:MAG: AI-2E family transporter [Phycisphaerae bacterium]
MPLDRDNLRWVQTACLFVIAVVAGGAAIAYLRGVLIPLVLAGLLTLCLQPIVQVLTTRARFPRVVAVVASMIVGVGVLALLSLIVSTSVARLAANVGTYDEAFTRAVQDVRDRIPFERMGVDEERFRRQFLEQAEATATAVVADLLGSVRGIFSNATLVVVFLIFLMAGTPARPMADTGSLRSQIELRIKRYLIVIILMSALTGLFVGTILWVLGVDFAVGFGLLAFLLNFIPGLGSTVATLLPVPVVLLSGMGPTQVLLAILLPTCVQVLIGNILQPKVLGESLDLHPVTILAGLIFFGILWGIAGMFLATPLIASAKIAMEKNEFTRPIALLMSGKLDNGLSAVKLKPAGSAAGACEGAGEGAAPAEPSIAGETRDGGSS